MNIAVPIGNIAEEGWMKEQLQCDGAQVSRPTFCVPLKESLVLSYGHTLSLWQCEDRMWQ